MAIDAYLKINDAPGESTDNDHKGWIEVLSFSFGATQPAQASGSTAGGGTSERVSIHDISFTKSVDKASAKLFELCCTGKHVNDATFEMFRASGDKRIKYLEFKLNDAIVSSYQIGGSGGEVATESFSLNFGKIVQTYVQQDRAGGAASGNVSAGWDLKANKKV
jgi:type VI secretion system secreted protein Hcp